MESFDLTITDFLQEDQPGHVQAFLILDIEDEEDSTRTIERRDIRQEAAEACNVSAARDFYQVGSSNEQGVDDKVAEHLWVPGTGEEESSEGEAEK